jgi:hypothetical protein
MERAVGAAFIETLDDIGEDIGRLPSIQFATDTNVGIKLGTDCISRQTVLDALAEISHEVDDGYGFDYAKWREYFCELPPELGTNLAQLGTDCISRQAAIDALDVLCQEHRYKIPGKGETYSQYNEAWQDALDRAEGAIFNLPPVEPKRGKWIQDRSGAYCCSECMEPCAGYVMMKPRDRFCKMCGAKMEGTT